MSREEVIGIVAVFAIYSGFPSIRAEKPSPATSLYKTILTCSEGDASFGCLKDKSVNLIYAAASLDKIALWDDTVALVKSKSAANSTANETSGRSFSDGLDEFMNSHRLQVTLPRLSFFLPTSEGKGKKNKGYGVIAMTIAGALMAAGMSVLAAMAGKALAASMAALAIATLSAMRKGGHGHGGHSSYEVISLPSTHRHRSFLEQLNDKPDSYKYQDPYHSGSMDEVK